ncbi:MAG: hypothetical protein ACI9SS_000487 [Gammaproteobacteria bacterium]|jgi:hypothetical protein
MKRSKNKLFIFLAGFLFIAAVSSDLLIHGHLDSNNSIIECEYCENKTFDISNPEALKIHFTRFKISSIEVKQKFISSNFQHFQSRAPPKKLNF